MTKETKKLFIIAEHRVQSSADTIQKVLQALDGVSEAEINPNTGLLKVTFDENRLQEEDITAAVLHCGYTAYPIDHQFLNLPEEKAFEQKASLLFCAAFSLMFPLIEFLHLPAWASLCLLMLFLFLVKDTLTELFDLFSKDPLSHIFRILTCLFSVLFGVLCALLRKPSAFYFLYPAVSLFFFISEQSFQNRDVFRTSKNMVSARSSHLPKTALIFDGRTEKMQNIEDIREGTTMLIRESQMIPADGIVLSGSALIDESFLTGNLVPVRKKKEAFVYAGSVCVKGSLYMKAERTGKNTATMHFARLTERAAADTSFPSVFSSIGHVLPFLIVLGAALAVLGWLWAGADISSAAMILLGMISCGALSAFREISADTVMHAARTAANEHILFKDAEALERISKADVFVIEQDDALTDHILNVSDFIPAAPEKRDLFEYAVYTLESEADNEVSSALIRYLRQQKLTDRKATSFRSLMKKGKRDLLAQENFRSLSKEQLDSEKISLSALQDDYQRCLKAGRRILFFLKETEIIGMAAFEKAILPGAEDALNILRENGSSVFLLTGGTKEEYEYLKQRIPSAAFIHDPLYQEKRELLGLQKEEGHTVAYISGSYIGALKEEADITVFINAGALFDQEDADVILTANHLNDLVRACRISETAGSFVQLAQMVILLYHAFALICFGFLFPSFLPFWCLPVIGCLFSFCMSVSKSYLIRILDQKLAQKKMPKAS